MLKLADFVAITLQECSRACRESNLEVNVICIDRLLDI